VVSLSDFAEPGDRITDFGTGERYVVPDEEPKEHEYLVRFEINIMGASAHDAATRTAELLCDYRYAHRGYYDVWVDNDQTAPPEGVDLEEDS
jgi:hypothetical protein